MGAPDTYLCPDCGGEAAVGSPCPGCTRRQRKKRQPAPPAGKSWEQDEVHDGLGLPDEDFDYDEFVAREFGRVPHRKLGVKWYWWVLGVVVLLAIATLIALDRW